MPLALMFHHVLNLAHARFLSGHDKRRLRAHTRGDAGAVALQEGLDFALAAVHALGPVSRHGREDACQYQHFAAQALRVGRDALRQHEQLVLLLSAAARAAGLARRDDGGLWRALLHDNAAANPACPLAFFLLLGLRHRALL
eukprot:6623994-Prymnesium_polylepis.1